MLSDAQVREMVVRNARLIYSIANSHGPIGAVCDVDDVAQAMFAEGLRVLHKYESGRIPEANFICLVMWRFLKKERKRFAESMLREVEVVDSTDTLRVPYFRVLFQELRAGLAGMSGQLADILDALLDCAGDYQQAALRLRISKRTVRRAVAIIRASNAGVLVAEAL